LNYLGILNGDYAIQKNNPSIYTFMRVFIVLHLIMICNIIVKLLLHDNKGRFIHMYIMETTIAQVHTMHYIT
jgi:hypothetical protein